MAAFRGNPVSGAGRPTKVQVANKRIVVPFEDNRYLTRLLGEYDSHLALIEDRLGIEAHAHGNVVILNGPEAGLRACARRARAALRARRRRRARSAPAISTASSATRARRRRPPTGRRRSPRAAASSRRARRCRAPICARSRRSTSCSASARPAPARPILPSPMRRTAWSAGWSSASSCRGRRSRRASGWASCRATCARRSIPTCARSMTRSTTCCRPRRWSAISRPASSRSRRSAFMRGRTLANAYVILDEAQNTTSMQMKMFLTRLGENSKMVVTGDPSQIDLPFGIKSGLEEAIALLARRAGHRGHPLHRVGRGAPRPRRPHRRSLRSAPGAAQTPRIGRSSRTMPPTVPAQSVIAPEGEAHASAGRRAADRPRASTSCTRPATGRSSMR